MKESVTAHILSGDRESMKMTLQSNIPFMYLKEHARFTYMVEPTFDPYAFESDSINSLEQSSKDSFYQRRVDPERVKKIKQFIRNTILDEYAGKRFGVVFPTSLLLAANTGDTADLNIDTDDISINSLIGEGGEFYIVDGQHRLYSMIELYKEITRTLIRLPEEDYILEYLGKYRFNCTILLNFDLWEQARVFADVNFNQRKVSRSLYYSIYGMHYSMDQRDLRNNYIFIAHQIVKFLNSNSESPLYGKIRMLGNGKGLISQAFVADALIRHIQSPRGIWFVDAREDKARGNYKYMVRELVTFLTVIRNKFKTLWPDADGKHKSILLKTTGLGALLRLMGFIHKNDLDDAIIAELNNEKNGYVVKEYYEKLSGLLEPIVHEQKRLFGLDGEFAKTGGKGLESRLYFELTYHLSSNPKFVRKKTVNINGIDVDFNIYGFNDGWFIYEQSHFFLNPGQTEVIRHGGRFVSDSLDGLLFKIDLYRDEVHPDAKAVPNEYFKEEK